MEPWQKSYYHLSRKLSMPCQYKSLTEVRPKGDQALVPVTAPGIILIVACADHYGYTRNALDGTKKGPRDHSPGPIYDIGDFHFIGG